jgi:hypothetical protein
MVGSALDSGAFRQRNRVGFLMTELLIEIVFWNTQQSLGPPEDRPHRLEKKVLSPKMHKGHQLNQLRV